MKKTKSTIKACSTLFGFILLQPHLSATEFRAIADGNWTNGGVWNQSGSTPESTDTAVLRANSPEVTINSDVGSVQGLTIREGELIITNSGSLETTSGSDTRIGTTADGTLTMNGGSSLTLTNSNILLASVADRTGTMTVSNATLDIGKNLFLGANNSANTTATVALNSGAVVSNGAGFEIIFHSYDNSTAQLSINTGASMVTNLVRFNDNSLTSTQSLWLNGGSLTLNASNEAGTFDFTDADASVILDSGTVTFAGVGSEIAFDNFVPVFNGWIDAGNIISNVYNDSALKSALSYQDGTGAVFSVPEPSAFALITALATSFLVLRRRAR